MTFFLYILLAILILLFMIMIHELGHYIAGKLLKFKIDEFSIGFGPKLLQKKRKNGELISLRAVPLGGYCAFYGEDKDDAEKSAEKLDVFESGEAAVAAPKAAVGEKTDERPLSFNEQKPWKRIIVLLAGASFNMLSAIIFSFIYILAVGYGLPVVSEVYYNGIVPYSSLKSGDIILEVDGKNVGVLDSYAELVSGYGADDTAVFTIIRNDTEMQIEMTVQKIEREGSDAYYGFGFAADYMQMNGNAGDAFAACVPYTMKLSWAILGSFGKIVTGQVALTEMSGPIGTVTAIAEYSSVDGRYILLFLPLIASNLAIFNLLPIPALDGMKIVFVAIEWIRKKPINRKVENIIHGVGLLVLFSFVILIDLIGMFLRL